MNWTNPDTLPIRCERCEDCIEPGEELTPHVPTCENYISYITSIDHDPRCRCSRTLHRECLIDLEQEEIKEHLRAWPGHAVEYTDAGEYLP